MRKIWRGLTLVVVFALLATSVAFAAPAPASDFNGTWRAKTNFTLGDNSMTYARLVFSGDKVAIPFFAMNLVCSYKRLDGNEFTITIPTNSLFNARTQTVKYSFNADKTKMTLSSSLFGTKYDQVFTKAAPKITKATANRVKRGKTTTIKVKTNAASDFVRLYRKSDNKLLATSTKRNGNVFTIKAAFKNKSNKVYVRSGLRDFDAKISSASKLSGKKNFTVTCR